MRPLRDTRPFWLKAKFGGKCSKCGFGFKRGSDVFYYPVIKKVLCAGDGCGKQAERDLRADDFDQAVYDGNW